MFILFSTSYGVMGLENSPPLHKKQRKLVYAFLELLYLLVRKDMPKSFDLYLFVLCAFYCKS